MSKPRKAPRGETAHMSARRRYTVYAIGAGVWLTGVAWLLFHYFVKSTDQFGFEAGHPSEPWWLRAHGAFSFAAIWIFGLMWGHVVKGWTMRLGRKSGGTLFGAIMLMTLTGYALYYLTSDDFRAWTSIAHWGIGLASLAVFIIHEYFRTTAKARREREQKLAAVEDTTA